jgi:hypothetical protein
MTPEQCRSLVDAIATAASMDVLAELHREVRREQGFDARTSFVDVLIDMRREKLARQAADTTGARTA